MANNNNLFNAVIAGAGGGNQQRWITDDQSSDYVTYQELITELAVAVDAAIDPISGDASTAESALMQSISQAVFSGRLIQSTQQANYAPIVEAIVALYSQLSTALEPSSSGGGGPGLSRVRYTDAATTLPTGEQTGTEGFPFKTIQQAIDDLAGDGTVVVSQGAYGGEVLTAGADVVITLQALGVVTGIASYTGSGNLKLIGFNDFGDITLTGSGTPKLTLIDTSISGTVEVDSSIVGLSTGKDERSPSLNGEITADEVDLFGYHVLGEIIAPFINGVNTLFSVISPNTLTAADCIFNSAITNTSGDANTYFVRDCEFRAAVNVEDALWRMYDCEFTEDVILDTTSVCNGCIFFANLTGLNTINAIGSFFTNITTPGLITVGCSIGGAVHVSGVASLIDTACASGIDAAGASLFVDTNTLQRALVSGAVNYTSITIADIPISATINITVPAIATATDVQYVDTTLVGSALEGLIPINGGVIVNPQADVGGAGGTIAAARISAANTLRVGFRGVTMGGPANFTVTRAR